MKQSLSILLKINCHNPVIVAASGITKKTNNAKIVLLVFWPFRCQTEGYCPPFRCCWDKAKVNQKENALRSNIKQHIGYTKINARVKKYPNYWILHNPHVVQSPIAKQCVKFSINGLTKNDFLILLFQVSIRTIHNIMVIWLEERSIK